ncbi:MAG: ATP-dependent DNA helicase RecG, partial [Dehalococcoidia bacterium]
MTADLGRLRGVLEQELEGGCPDASVDGGLDELLREQARGEQPRSPLLRMVAALPAEGYRVLDAEARRKWARRAIATIAMEEASGSKRGAAPARRRTRSKPPARPQTPARAPATRKIPPGAAALDLPLRDARTGLRGPTFERLERLGLHTVGDALRHYPRRHNDFSQIVPISELRAGVEQTIRGTIDRAREIRMGRGGRMRSTEVQVTDEAGTRIRVVWFNQPYLARSMREGAQIAVSGLVRAYRNRPTFQNPEFELLNETNGKRGQTHTGRLVPVYPLTERLAQRTLRSLIASMLDQFADRVPETLPDEVRDRHGLIGIVEATRQGHYPDDQHSLAEARRRLAFDELLAIQLGVVRRKREWQEDGDAPAIDERATADAFVDGLPFELTGAQRRALDDVLGDISRTVPMARLMEGDVGSGKTVVALAAMLSAVASGQQAVLMAPTEVLAEQHFRTICTLLSGEAEPPLHGLLPVPYLPLPLRAVLLTGSTRAKERRDAIDAIAHGGAQIIVGTHALIEDAVEYQRLGITVIDEQHRFGVMQRSALRAKSSHGSPHLLVMTATPIPRSLALTIYGDLDLTVIDEMPPGRTPIVTRWLPPDARDQAFDALRAEVDAGRQAFVICPLVEGSEAVISRAATEEYERLCTEQYPDLADRIELLHGRMAGRTKGRVMQRFASGETAILVSTSVVEVGIDIPNATVMLIEGADRFGLAQLHQFRGRVGRGEHPSFCFLLADDPGPEAEERLSTVERTSDGFALAQADLELRGAGELYGTRQSGVPTLRVASLLDAQMIDATRREAETLLEEDPELASADHRELRAHVIRIAESVVDEVH